MTFYLVDLQPLPDNVAGLILFVFVNHAQQLSIA